MLIKGLVTSSQLRLWCGFKEQRSQAMAGGFLWGMGGTLKTELLGSNALPPPWAAAAIEGWSPAATGLNPVSPAE